MLLLLLLLLLSLLLLLLSLLPTVSIVSRVWDAAFANSAVVFDGAKSQRCACTMRAPPRRYDGDTPPILASTIHLSLSLSFDVS
jgi:hypothetical protein